MLEKTIQSYCEENETSDMLRQIELETLDLLDSMELAAEVEEVSEGTPAGEYT